MMKTRLAVLELAAQQRLGPDAFAALWRLAAFDTPPAGQSVRLRRALLLLGALMVGLGLVFYVAANWKSLDRTAQFALLQGAAVAACGGAALSRRARTPLALLALLAIGALLAFFGQTYQTGADPWQLFALWAVLGLPLALGARADAVWSAWTVVAMTAILLWGIQGLSSFERYLHGLAVAALLACALAALLPASRGHTGAGPWSSRLATLMAALLVGAVGVIDLFEKPSGAYCLAALLVFGASARIAASRARFDLVTLCIAALGLNALLDAVVMRLVLSGPNSAGGFLFVGLVAAALLAWTVALILPLARRASREEEA